jgi:hypothetical protein
LGTSLTWVAVAIGGSALVGAGASYLGSKKQAEGAKRSQDINLDMFRQVMAQQQPFVQGGYGAMSRLNTLLGLNPNPRAQNPQFAPGQQFMPTPGGGVQPIMQVGPTVPTPRTPPRSASQGARLNDLLLLRAAHGDRQAQALLRGGV